MSGGTLLASPVLSLRRVVAGASDPSGKQLPSPAQLEDSWMQIQRGFPFRPSPSSGSKFLIRGLVQPCVLQVTWAWVPKTTPRKHL